MDENWPRWIYSSIANHFKENDSKLRLFIEGQDRLQDQLEGAELSINGPFYNNPSKGTWILEVPIIILINTFTNDQDIYKVKRQQGFFVKRYTSAINVFKYGTPGDDSYLGCLVLKTEINTQILEQISTNMRLIQSVLSAIYEIELSG